MEGQKEDPTVSQLQEVSSFVPSYLWLAAWPPAQCNKPTSSRPEPPKPCAKIGFSLKDRNFTIIQSPSGCGHNALVFPSAGPLRATLPSLCGERVQLLPGYPGGQESNPPQLISRAGCYGISMLGILNA